MIWFGKKLNKNYGWELAFFHRVRDFSDGITFFEWNITLDRYLADHTPRFTFELNILNYKIVEFGVYYLHHRDEE